MGTGGVGFGNHDGDIRRQHGVHAILQQFDGAGAVDEHPGLIQKCAAGEIRFGGHAPFPGLATQIAQRLAGRRTARPFDGARLRQQCFEQGGLTAALGPHDRRASCARLCLAHNRSPLSSV